MSELLAKLLAAITAILADWFKSNQIPTIDKVVKLRGREVDLSKPVVGKFVVESHYSTPYDRDNFLHGTYPTSQVDHINEHLQMSWDYLVKNYPSFQPVTGIKTKDELYREIWETEWQPAEGGGKFGGNAREIMPTVPQELFSMNQMYIYESMPKPGTKRVVRNPANNRMVVVECGLEQGPGSPTALGGLSIEAMAYLGAQHGSDLELQWLDDQSIPLGPLGIPAKPEIIETQPWMTWMLSHLHEKEVTGAPATAFNVAIFKHTNYGSLNGVMDAGCAATACAALEETGYKSPHDASAISFKGYGTPCELRPGCVVVFQWASGEHHISFCHDIVDQSLVNCLGGNQSHELNISEYQRKFIIYTGWPVKA